MIATINVAKFTGIVECITFNGTQFRVRWIDTGN